MKYQFWTMSERALFSPDRTVQEVARLTRRKPRSVAAYASRFNLPFKPAYSHHVELKPVYFSLRQSGKSRYESAIAVGVHSTTAKRWEAAA